MGLGWQENGTATGRIRRALRRRGRRNNRGSDCPFCQNQRRLLERFVDVSGTRHLMWVVCRYCEGKE